MKKALAVFLTGLVAFAAAGLAGCGQKTPDGEGAAATEETTPAKSTKPAPTPKASKTADAGEGEPSEPPPSPKPSPAAQEDPVDFGIPVPEGYYGPRKVRGEFLGVEGDSWRIKQDLNGQEYVYKVFPDFTGHVPQVGEICCFYLVFDVMLTEPEYDGATDQIVAYGVYK
ncbi:MAG: hypothetical protein LBC97_07165 [Bifidobacteriaceae bacterium]|jgi:hypothetical protein|nr:hypothetical protein [Bifidobacteriaceae bacterium]